MSTRRGMTLLEVTVSITVLGIIAAVVMPLMVGATDAYANAAHLRRVSEGGLYAMDRSVRLLRDCPAGTKPGEVGISQAATGAVRFTDGRGLELSGTTLLLRAADGSQATLCEGVTLFELNYLNEDGVTSTLATPLKTQRFGVRIRTREYDLWSAAFVRERTVDE